MKSVELGKTKEKVSQISPATMLMSSATDRETSVAMLDRATAEQYFSLTFLLKIYGAGSILQRLGEMNRCDAVNSC